MNSTIPNPDAALFPAPHAGRFVPHLRRRRHSATRLRRGQFGAAGRDLLVSIFLRGGCDGLGVLAPVDDAHYRLRAMPPFASRRKEKRQE